MLGKIAAREIEKNIGNINEEKIISESEFTRQLFDSGLVQIDTYQFINFKRLYNLFKEYRKNKNCFNNKITGEIIINKEDINKDILIINSFENYKRMKESEGEEKEEDDDEDCSNYENEEEIK